mmetsp:Transcript_45953/g.111306  ORF Transcript_45953/g.111306 Transcript_45953/m.111306 type:complete len:426 (-) Transcript_45953:278-1555(-)
MKAYKCRIQIPLRILILSLLLTSIHAQGLDDNDGNFPGDPLGDLDDTNDPFLDSNNDGEDGLQGNAGDGEEDPFNNDSLLDNSNNDGFNDGIPSLAPTTSFIESGMPTTAGLVSDGDGIPSLSPTIGDGLGGDGGGGGDGFLDPTAQQSVAPTFDFNGLDGGGGGGDDLDGNDGGDDLDGEGNGDNTDGDEASEAPSSMSLYPSVAPTIPGGGDVPSLTSQRPSIAVNVDPTFSMQPSFSMQPTTPLPPHHTVAPHHTFAPHAGGSNPTTGNPTSNHTGSHTGNPSNHTGSHSGNGGNHQGSGNNHQSGGNNHQGSGGNHQGGGNHQSSGGNHQSGGGKNQGGGGHDKHGATHKHHNGGGGQNPSLGKDDVESLTLPIVIFVGVVALSIAFYVAQRVKNRRHFSQVQNDDMNWDLELSTYRPGLT